MVRDTTALTGPSFFQAKLTSGQNYYQTVKFKYILSTRFELSSLSYPVATFKLHSFKNIISSICFRIHTIRFYIKRAEIQVPTIQTALRV